MGNVNDNINEFIFVDIFEDGFVFYRSRLRIHLP
jgi:hypothetical protein